MDTLQSLMMGFGLALTPENLLFAFLGCLWGTLVGVLPGVGPAAGTALLIPLTFQLPPTGAIIMLAAIYYGSQYGGTVTSVLLNVPGEAASAITCIDGYQMAKQGRGGVALSIAAIGSFVGGTLAVVGLVLAAPPLASLALRFGPPESFALMAVGLSLLMGLAGKSMLKALIMGVLGLLLAIVGMDPGQGSPRFIFGQMELLDGLHFVPVIMGLFGIGEILISVEGPAARILDTKLRTLIPSRKDVGDSVWPVLRGTGIGFFLGLIPGMTNSVGSFMSYIAEKKLSRYPDRFGTGVIEGVAGPETANNSHANAALIPLVTLGIPASPTMAILMGAFMMNGLIPGPFLFVEHPDVIWAVIASLYVGNIMLLILNLPLIGLWVSVLRIPQPILFGLILVFMLVGSYSIGNSFFDVGTMVLFGVLGYLFRKLDFPLAPTVLTFILGPIMEKKLRASLEMSEGDFGILFESPISTTLLILAGVFLIMPVLRFLLFRGRGTRGESVSA